MTIALIAAALTVLVWFVFTRWHGRGEVARTTNERKVASKPRTISGDSLVGDDPMATVQFHLAELKSRVPVSGGVDVRDRQPRLVGVSKGVHGFSFPLQSTGAIIGRAHDNQIQVNDPLVSQRHAWVGLVHGKAMVSDLNSTNGTFLNTTAGAPISDAELKPNDTVMLGGHGGTQFRFITD